jgi:hypothetical protein
MSRLQESPSPIGKDVFATHEIRLIAARLAGRHAVQGYQDPGRFSAMAYGFRLPLLGQDRKQSRDLSLVRAERHAKASILGFANSQIEAQKGELPDTTPRTLDDHWVRTEALGGTITAEARVNHDAPIRTLWSVEITNRRAEPTILAVETNNIRIPGVTNLDEDPEQRRVPYIALVDPTAHVPYSTDFYAYDRGAQIALYRTVETTFALLGNAQRSGSLETHAG